MKDVKMLAKLIVQSNQRGGDADPVLRKDMCCCTTVDWEDLGRSSAWAGYHDCDENRMNELYYGNMSLNGGYGVFTGTRTIDTDLAFLSPAATVFPWIIERQTVSFDRDGFFAAAWMGTNGEVWSYYPGFNQVWPGHFFGDIIGPSYNGREDIFVRPTLPVNNPLQKSTWTQPYVDPAGAGNMISAITPVYFDGEFRGHVFRDEYVASTGIDILLMYMEQLVSQLKPSASALPMVLDDQGHIVSAPPEVVEVIFGQGATLEGTIRCDGEGDAMSMQLLSCPIMTSSSAQWGWLMDRVLSLPKGQSMLLDGLLAVPPPPLPPLPLRRHPSSNHSLSPQPRDDEARGRGTDEAREGGRREGEAVLHHVAVFRWEAEDSPAWNSIVLVPQPELAHAARWEAPAELTASLPTHHAVTHLQMSLSNTGVVDLVLRLKNLPAFASLRQTPADPASLAAVGDLIPFPSGRVVSWEVTLSAALTDGAGTHRTALAFEVFDDDYPDCAASDEVSVAVTVTVQEEQDHWLLIAAVLASLAALAVGVLLCTTWKRRQADKLWSVSLKDLHFKTDPPEVLGRGTYGMVVAAEFRKTHVAVKRVVPPTVSTARKNQLFGWGSAGDETRRLLDQLFALARDPGGGSNGGVSDQPRRSTSGGTGGGMASSWKMSSQFSRSGPAGTSGTSLLQYHHAPSHTLRPPPHLHPQGGGLSKRWWSRGWGTCCMSQRDRLRHSFVQEMRLLAELRHPCITTMMGAVVQRGCEPMLIMELMDFGSLRDIIDNPTVELSGELVIPMLRQVAQGLTYLHHYPLVHGDVSAKNVLVDSQFRAKVSDFGLSAKKYASHGPAGTPFWMAPELLRGEANSPQSDVFAFGVTMWEVYARAEPYAGEEAQGVLMAVANLNVAVDSGLSAKRPKMALNTAVEAQRIIKDCWHTDPSCRPPSEEIDRMLRTLDPRSMGPPPRQSLLRHSETASSPSLSYKGKQQRAPTFYFHATFPLRVADKLAAGQAVVAERSEEVSLVVVSVTPSLLSNPPPEGLWEGWGAAHTRLKELAQARGMFTLDTVDDTFIAVANLEDQHGHDHAVRAALVGLEAMDSLLAAGPGEGVEVRVGIHAGPVVGHVVGSRAPRFSLFGDTLSTALWMANSSQPGKVHSSQRSATMLRTQVAEAHAASAHAFDLVCRGSVEVRGKRELTTFWLSRPVGLAGEDVRLPAGTSLEHCGFPGLRIPLRSPSSLRPSSSFRVQPGAPAAAAAGGGVRSCRSARDRKSVV